MKHDEKQEVENAQITIQQILGISPSQYYTTFFLISQPLLIFDEKNNI